MNSAEFGSARPDVMVKFNKRNVMFTAVFTGNKTKDYEDYGAMHYH